MRFNSIRRRVAASSTVSSFPGGRSIFRDGGAGGGCDGIRAVSSFCRLGEDEGEGEGEVVASESSSSFFREDFCTVADANADADGEDVVSRACAFLRRPPRRLGFFFDEGSFSTSSCSSGVGSGVALFEGVDCFLGPRRPRRGAFAGGETFDPDFAFAGGEGEALRSLSSSSVSVSSSALLSFSGGEE